MTEKVSPTDVRRRISDILNRVAVALKLALEAQRSARKRLRKARPGIR